MKRLGGYNSTFRSVYSVQWAHTSTTAVTSTTSFPPAYYHGLKDLFISKVHSPTQTDGSPTSQVYLLPLCLSTTDSVQWALTPLSSLLSPPPPPPPLQGSQSTIPPVPACTLILQQSTSAAASPRVRHSPEDDQSILIEMSSCNLQFFSELITTQLRDFHMVSPQVVFLTQVILQNQLSATQGHCK